MIQINSFEVCIKKPKQTLPPKLSNFNNSDDTETVFSLPKNDPGIHEDSRDQTGMVDLDNPAEISMLVNQNSIESIPIPYFQKSFPFSEKTKMQVLNSTKNFQMIEIDSQPSEIDSSTLSSWFNPKQNSSKKEHREMLSKELRELSSEMIPQRHCNGTTEQVHEFEWMYYLALQGNLESKFTLGYLYDTGSSGVVKNTDQSIHWYYQAACHGHVIAQNNLGVLYSSGHRGLITPDEGEALYWYSKAANAGYPNAQFHLGLMYLRGVGVEKKSGEVAFIWFKKAAKSGHVNSILNVGAMYLNGKGILKNAKKGFKWTKKAYLRGNKVAAHNLAVLYEHGIWVKRSHDKALSYLNESKNGHERVRSSISSSSFSAGNILMIQ